MTSLQTTAQANPYLPHPYTVLEYHRETPDSFTITVDMATDHAPGQFVQVSLPGVGESPISICSDSREHLKLNIREVGAVTRKLAALKKGDTVFLRGPYGNGYPMSSLSGNNLLIIGGGCGVAPLKGIIDYVENHRADYADVQLFLGYRSPDDVIFQRELEEWRGQYQLQITVDKNPDHASCYDAREGFITDALSDAPLKPKGTVAFICGPPIMLKGVIALLKERGFRDNQIFISAERLMYCAVGACCHCMIRHKFCCVDGPVFRYDEVSDYDSD